MEQNNFLQEHFKITLCLQQLKDTLNILVALLGVIRENLIEYQKKTSKNINQSEKNFAPTFVDHHILLHINFNRGCLTKSNISVPKKVIKLYISYKLNPQLRNLNTDFTLNNGLFVWVKLTKNADLDKYKYSGYGIGSDSRSEFSFADGSITKYVTIFGADISSYPHSDN